MSLTKEEVAKLKELNVEVKFEHRNVSQYGTMTFDDDGYHSYDVDDTEYGSAKTIFELWDSETGTCYLDEIEESELNEKIRELLEELTQ